MAFKEVMLAPLLGLNEDENPQALRDTDLSVAINCWRLGGTTGTRPGIEREDSGDPYDAKLTGPPADQNVQGMIEYRNNFDASADRHLVVVANGQIWRNDTTNITDALTITAGQNNLWTFAQHKNYLYAAGGASGDAFWVWDGVVANAATLVTFLNSGASQIDCKYVFQKWNFVFACGMNGTAAEDNPTIVRYSALGDGASWPVANTIGGTAAIGGFNAYGNEYTTGFGSYTDNNGDYLMVGTNRAIYSILLTGDATNPFFVQGEAANGFVSQRAYVSLGVDAGDAVYLSERGIHSLRQSQQFGAQENKFLTWGIRNTFKNLNRSRLKYASGAYWQEEGIVLFAVSSASSTTNDVILALDLKGVNELTSENAVWHIWKLSGGISPNILVAARDDDGQPYIYVGTTTADVCRFSREVYSDLGSSYPVEFQTKFFDFGAPMRDKCIGDCQVTIQPSGTHIPKMKYVYDFGRRQSTPRDLRLLSGGFILDSSVLDVDELGMENPTAINKVFGNGWGEAVALSFTHQGANEPFRVARIAMQVDLMGETQGDFAGGS